MCMNTIGSTQGALRTMAVSVCAVSLVYVEQELFSPGGEAGVERECVCVSARLAWEECPWLLMAV